MVAPGRNIIGAARQADHVDGRIPVESRAITKLSEIVPAPALYAARLCNGAGMATPAIAATGGHSRHDAAQALYGHRRGSVRRCAVAKLASVVVPPALDSAEYGKSASVEPAA